MAEQPDGSEPERPGDGPAEPAAPIGQDEEPEVVPHWLGGEPDGPGGADGDDGGAPWCIGASSAR